MKHPNSALLKKLHRRWPAAVTTLIHVGDQVTRLLQVRHTPHGPELLILKTRPTAGLTAQTLTAFARACPMPPSRVLLVLSKAQVLTRYLTLPAEDPGELVTMARYAVADTLPYAMDECVVAIQRLKTLEKKTTVLAAIVPKQIVDRLVTLLTSAGFEPQAVAIASEGLARWHGRLLPPDTPGARLLLETLGDTVELAIVEGDYLLSLRSVPLPPTPDALGPWLVTQVQDTLHGYTQEHIGPPVATITVSGPTVSAQGMVATLSEHLNLPIQVADPTANPFSQSLAHHAEALTHAPWNDLLGLALAPTPLTLDLLPAEVRHAQAVQAAQRVGLRALAWAGLCAWLGTVVVGLVLLTHIRWQQALTVQMTHHQPAATRAQAIAQYLAQVSGAQQAYTARLTLVTELQTALPGAITIEQLSLQGAALTLQGSAPSFADVTAGVEQLSRLTALTDLTLARVTAEQGGRVPFTVEAELPESRSSSAAQGSPAP